MRQVMAGVSEACSDSNDELRQKFEQLHSIIVNLDLTTAAHELFSLNILSAYDLHCIQNSQRKTEKLLDLLHSSHHTSAFTALRRAVRQEPAYMWLVKKMDALKLEDQTRDWNAVLRQKFQRLHAEVIGLDLSSAIHELFSRSIISADNMNELRCLQQSRSKAETLLLMLHMSRHPDAFTELRYAIEREPGYRWLVTKIDELELQNSDNELQPLQQHSYTRDDLPLGSARHQSVDTADRGRPSFRRTASSEDIKNKTLPQDETNEVFHSAVMNATVAGRKSRGIWGRKSRSSERPRQPRQTNSNNNSSKKAMTVIVSSPVDVEPKSFKHAFDGCRDKLLDMIKPSEKLLNKLRDKKMLTMEMLDEINHMDSDHSKANLLLDALECRPPEELPIFYSALIDDHHEHIVRFIRNLPKQMEQVGGLVAMRNLSSGEDNSDGALEPSSRSATSRVASVATDWLIRRPLKIWHKTIRGELPTTPNDLEPEISPKEITVYPSTEDFYAAHNQTSTYPMDRNCRGVACIIGVGKTAGCSYRHGTEADRQRLKVLFKKLNFDVAAYSDRDGLTSREILDKIKATAASDEYETRPLLPQCYVLIILSRSVTDQVTTGECILGNDGLDGKLSQQTILDALAAEANLKDVPRLVFFICCREEMTLADAAVLVMPKDFLVALPSKDACFSMGDEREGCLYVQAIVKLFMERAHDTDIIALLKKVNYEVWKNTIRHELVSGVVMDGTISDYDSQLQKELYFFPGITK